MLHCEPWNSNQHLQSCSILNLCSLKNLWCANLCSFNTIVRLATPLWWLNHSCSIVSHLIHNLATHIKLVSATLKDKLCVLIFHVLCLLYVFYHLTSCQEHTLITKTQSVLHSRTNCVFIIHIQDRTCSSNYDIFMFITQLHVHHPALSVQFPGHAK